MHTGHVWIKLHHIPMGFQSQIMEQLMQGGDCDGNLWVIDDQATAHLGNVSPEKKRRWLWMSIIMPVDIYRGLKFIDNCYDLARGNIPHVVRGSHAQLDVFSGLKGREFKAIVQVDELGRMHSLDTGLQFDNHVKYARLINSIRLALDIDDDYLIDIRSRYKPEWKAKISIVFLETEDQRVTIEIKYCAYVRTNGKEPLIQLDGLQYKLCTFEVARLAKDTVWEQVLEKTRQTEAASQGRRCFINGLDHQPTPEQIVSVLGRSGIRLESTPIITRSKHPSSKGKPQWRALVVCEKDEMALWLCLQGPKIPIGNGTLYIKPAQPRGSRNLKEAQDAEELRHRDFGPTDGLNSKQIQMLRDYLETQTEERITDKCKKMQEHLELVVQGEAGIRPQHSLLYDSLSARMDEAERRITDVEYKQRCSSDQLDHIQQQLAQMQMQIGQLPDGKNEIHKIDKQLTEMQKQIKMVALADGLLSTDTMDVPHLPEIQRDDEGDDGVYDDDNSLSAMPPYNPDDSLDQEDGLAATQDMHTDQMLSNSPHSQQHRPSDPHQHHQRHQQQRPHLQPDQQQYTQHHQQHQQYQSQRQPDQQQQQFRRPHQQPTPASSEATIPALPAPAPTATRMDAAPRAGAPSVDGASHTQQRGKSDQLLLEFRQHRAGLEAEGLTKPTNRPGKPFTIKEIDSSQDSQLGQPTSMCEDNTKKRMSSAMADGENPVDSAQPMTLDELEAGEDMYNREEQMSNNTLPTGRRKSMQFSRMVAQM
jgi:hypothetical protein